MKAPGRREVARHQEHLAGPRGIYLGLGLLGFGLLGVLGVPVVGWLVVSESFVYGFVPSLVHPLDDEPLFASLLLTQRRELPSRTHSWARVASPVTKYSRPMRFVASVELMGSPGRYVLFGTG